MIGQIIGSVIGLLIGGGMIAGTSVLKKQGKLSKHKQNFWLLLGITIMVVAMISLLFIPEMH